MYIRGKVMKCKACGITSLREFKHGYYIFRNNHYQQIDKRVENKNIPDYISEGCFKYQTAICEHCIDKVKNVIVIADDNVIMKYYNTYEYFLKLGEKLKAEIKKKLINELSVEILEKINHTTFYELKETKYNMTFEEKKASARRYVKKASGDIVRYVKNELCNHPEFLKIKGELLTLEEEIRSYTVSNHKSRYYIDEDCKNKLNLGSFRSDNNIEKDNVKVKFYVGCADFVHEIISRFKYKKRYNTTIINNDINDLRNRLPEVIAQLNIWD